MFLNNSRIRVINDGLFSKKSCFVEQPSQLRSISLRNVWPLAQLPPRPFPELILPKIAILLCTLNGQRFLPEQLESFESQTHANWQVWASDDGSQDDTLAILESFKAKWGEDKLMVGFGPAKGYAANFLGMTRKNHIHADFYAYSDQDDIWEAEKLERAIAWLQTVPKDTPALYCSRTLIVDADNSEIGFSPLFTRPPSFANALMQNIGGGNTMVFNNATRELLLNSCLDFNIVSHDWWTYIVVTGCGGSVFYDSVPSLRYRQHDNNQVGSNCDWSARYLRTKRLLQGNLRNWNDQNIQALKQLEGKLLPENHRILDQFVRSRSHRLIPRLIGLKRSGIYRQTQLGNLGLIMAAALKKI